MAHTQTKDIYILLNMKFICRQLLNRYVNIRNVLDLRGWVRNAQLAKFSIKENKFSFKKSINKL